MTSYSTPRGPLQPQALDTYNEPTTRLKKWMNTLPASAFQMKGKLQLVPTKTPQPDDRRRILHSDCPNKAATAEEQLKGWPSVSYQVARPSSWGLEGFDGVIVAYHMPANESDGNETFYVGVPTSDWLAGKLDAQQARNWVLYNLTLTGWPGLMPVMTTSNFSSVQKQQIDRPTRNDGALGSRRLAWLFGRAK